MASKQQIELNHGSILALPDAEVYFFENYYSATKAHEYLQQLLTNVEWKQDEIVLFGKKLMQPRLTAFFGNNKASYSYSNLKMQPLEFIPPLQKIKEELEHSLGEKFSSCLANLYRNGKDSISWHSDDEKDLIKNSTIASLSFGATRTLHFRHKKNPKLKLKLALNSGSLLLMKAGTQQFYQHQIPKTKQDVGPRINLTFRQIEI